MHKYWLLVIVILIWGIGSGFVLRFSVPLMKDIQDNTLILLSAFIPLMFLPGILVYIWKFPIWWVLLAQILISLVAALISGYFIDTISSYLLLGVASLVIIYVATLLSSNTKNQVLLSYILSFIVLTGLNVYGHNISENGISLLIKTIFAMAVSFLLCFLGTIKILNE